LREPTFNNLMSLPNLLSLSRIPLGGAFWLVLGPTARGSIWAFLVMGIAALTDVLDGYLARRQAQRAGGAPEPDGGTGAWLDPICDKVFVGAVLAAIIVKRHPAPLIIALILTRELAQLPMGIAYRFIPTLRSWLRYDFRASLLGKAATVAQFLAIAALTLDHASSATFAVIAFVLGIAALADYMRRAVRLGKIRIEQERSDEPPRR
jgi:cardiolipin synthase